MPTIQRKRRAPQADDESETAGPSNATQQSRRRRISRSPEADQVSEAGSYAGSETGGNANDGSNLQLFTKKFVRYALACEYARQPIKRQDITTKVLGSASRQFASVFAEAQLTLRHTFGMEMMELPVREKVTIREKRAAQKSDKAPVTSKAWVLASTLPPKYREATVVPPSQTPSTETENAYVGLYTMIVSLILLAGGSLPEAKLERYLGRMNAERTTPVDTTDKLLAKMVRDGYVVKVRDNSSGEEVVDYMVGPRGKVEIGQDSVAELVKTVYGDGAPDDLQRRLDRSLRLNEQQSAPAPNGVNAKGEGRSRGKRQAQQRRAVEQGGGDDSADETDDSSEAPSEGDNGQ